MKTIKEYLEEFPEPYRTQALENSADWTKEVESGTPYTSIHEAFVW